MARLNVNPTRMELKKLKDKWSEDKIPGYGINIGDKNAGMQGH